MPRKPRVHYSREIIQRQNILLRSLMLVNFKQQIAKRLPGRVFSEEDSGSTEQADPVLSQVGERT